MATNSITARAAAALPFIGIALALANWNARPDAALAWAATIVIFVAMVIARHYAPRAVRRSSAEAPSLRGLPSVTTAVVFGALMVIIPLAVNLAHAYGVVDDPDSGQRMTMIILGAYIAVSGNAMPRMLPPVSSMQSDIARVQTFQRFAGWTWTLCGLGYSAAWLALPIDAAGPASTAVVVAAIIVTVVLLLRLRKPRPAASLN